MFLIYKQIFLNSYIELTLIIFGVKRSIIGINRLTRNMKNFWRELGWLDKAEKYV